jgi:hypothetical protein
MTTQAKIHNALIEIEVAKLEIKDQRVNILSAKLFEWWNNNIERNSIGVWQSNRLLNIKKNIMNKRQELWNTRMK